MLILASSPLFWKPLRGQSPRERVDKATQPPRAQSTDKTTSPQAGTQDSPFFVDGIGRAKSTKESADAKKDKDHASLIERWTLGFAGAVAGCTLALAVIGYCGVRAANRTLIAIRKQGIQMARQTKAIEGSVRLSASQLEMAERPWLSVRLSAHGDITYDQLGINIPVQLEIKNIGKTPASQVDVEAITYCLGGNRDARKVRNQLINDMRHGNTNVMSRTIFPDEPETIPMPLLAQDHTRRFETMREIAGSPGDVVCMVAIVCVIYRPTFKTEIPYYTAVIYDIGRLEAEGKLSNVLKPGEAVSSGNWYVKRQGNRGTVAG